MNAIYTPDDPALPIEVRYAEPLDMGFIYTSWASYERHNTSAHLAPHSLFDEEQLAKMNYLAERSTMLIINLQQETDTIIGFIVFKINQDQTILHYAFIKSPFRNKGILTNILHYINPTKKSFILTAEPNPIVFKHLTKTFSIIYDPFYFQRASFII